MVLIAVRRLSTLAEERERLFDEACCAATLPPPAPIAASTLEDERERLTELPCKVPMVPATPERAPSMLVEEVTRFACEVFMTESAVSILADEVESWVDDV